MDEFVVDTHALFWYLTNSMKIGKKAIEVFDKAEKGKALIYIPSIVIAELYYLNERCNYPLNFKREYERLAEVRYFCFVEFSAEDVLLFDEIANISEIHDRIIVAVAKKLDIPCLTKDEEIVKSGAIQTIW
ncbi:MAG: PIN domain-containing protein [Candidatus Stahlbacteria bacterium]|nr:PIN domain-containing protein [Candidatus Stahlbacteria bacterium]